MQEWLTKNHSITAADGFLVETIEVVGGAYEWQFLSPSRTLIYRSQHGYGNPIAAIRDGLFVVLGEPSLGADRIEKIRNEIRTKTRPA
ncbi:hypothetical protein V6259_18600 [Marinomonas sp. TI.3.20]|uniref:hypothetical protein n=1 Tax=Marinomonas sp. TI.3.20 TaxID=3121296 RepID=UPI00311F2920